MEFGDLRSAARMRDLVERIATKTIDKKRPEIRIGYVNNYDSGRQLAWIKFPGDDELVKVRIALNMLPTRTIAANGEASADIVRVAGKPGAYYVTDFVRGVPQSPDNIPVVDVNFNNQKGINAADATGPQDVLNLRTADAKYATIASVNSKEPALPAGTSAQYIRGDKQLGTMNKAAVGLDQVDNTSDANKPVSTATQSALNLKANLNSPAFTGTPTGITKAHVGLGNVDNTADTAKPVSTPQQTALNLKADATAVVNLTADQSVDGIKNFVKQVRMTGLGASPATPPADTAQIYTLSSDFLPRWKGPDGIEKFLIPPREAVHDNPNFETWSTQTKGGGGTTPFPTGWNPFWQGASTVNSADSVDKVSGNYSLKIVREANSVSTDNATRVHGAQTFAVNGGDTVTFDIYMKASSASGYVGIGLISAATADGADFFSGDSTAVVSERNVNLTTAWRKYQVSFVIPAGNKFARFTLMPNTLSTTEEVTFWLDDSGSSILTPAAGQTILTGEVKIWPATAIPEGYLLCDGSVYNNVDYPVLAAVLGNTFGGVSGTSFAVPDLRRRVPSGTGTLVPLGRSDGDAETTRTFSHSHSIPSHSHAAGSLWAQASSTTWDTRRVVESGTANVKALNHTHAIDGNTAAGGAGTTGISTYDGTIPYLAVNFIIKT